MLCQLVCVDRRYQRMNCFNIRELQGILKRKFFTDLVNTSDSHSTMDSTMIGMRHKSNMSNILLYDQTLFYNLDLTNTSKSKNLFSNDLRMYNYSFVNLLQSFVQKGVSNLNNLLVIPTLTSTLNIVIKDFFLFLNPIFFTSITSLTLSLSYLKYTFLTSFYLYSPIKFFYLSLNKKSDISNNASGISYSSSFNSYVNTQDYSNKMYSDSSNT